MSEPLGELEFYLKRAEATAKRNGERYALITMMVNKNTYDAKDTIHGDSKTILNMVVYLLSKVILNIWDRIPSDQERVDLLTSVTQDLIENVNDAWKNAQENKEE